MASYWQRLNHVVSIPHGFSIHNGMISQTPHTVHLGFGTHTGNPAPPNPMNPHFGSPADPAAVVGAAAGALRAVAARTPRPTGVQAFRLPGNTKQDPFRSVLDRLSGKA